MKDFSKMSDSELTTILKSDKKSSKEAAFAEIYNRYNNMVYNYCVKFLNNRNDAYDVFQDIFLNFIQYVNREGSVNNLKHFLLKSSRNSCINYIKKHKEKVELDLDKIDFYSEEIEYDKLEKLRYAISLLEPSLKEVTILRYYEDLSYEEIANMINESLGVVRNRIYRGKKRIIEILEKLNKKDEKKIKINK